MGKLHLAISWISVLAISMPLLPILVPLMFLWPFLALIYLPRIFLKALTSRMRGMTSPSQVGDSPVEKRPVWRTDPTDWVDAVESKWEKSPWESPTDDLKIDAPPEVMVRVLGF